MLLAPIVKLVRAYDAVEWEIFISEWQKGLQGYHAVKRIGGAGDMGRDVVGLCSPDACQGVWDNYQCKHYEKALGVPRACEDAATRSRPRGGRTGARTTTRPHRAAARLHLRVAACSAKTKLIEPRTA